ncbi:MAG: hypothetical protein SGILL_006639, partial [Bacillariaceae sp.]
TPPISLLEIASSSSGAFVSPVGKTTVVTDGKAFISSSSGKNSSSNYGISPAATVAETPSPTSGTVSELLGMSPPSLHVTRLQESPVVAAAAAAASASVSMVMTPNPEQQSKQSLQQQPPPLQQRPFDEASPTKEPPKEATSSPVKPFDEAVDDSGGNFEDVWASAQSEEDRMYLLSTMMTEIPSPTKQKEDTGKHMALPYLSPGTKSPADVATTYYGPPPLVNSFTNNSIDKALKAIEEAPVATATAAVDISHGTPSTAADSAQLSGSNGAVKNSNLLAFTPNNDQNNFTTTDCSLKPHALFNSAEKMDESNKEDVPPGPRYDSELSDEEGPDDEPGKLVPVAIFAGQKKSSTRSQKFNEDMPWDCVEDFGAYDDAEVAQLIRMKEEQRQADLEVGCLDAETRRSVLQKAFKKEPESFKNGHRLESRTARQSLKSMRKLSSIHPPEMIEFEVKSVTSGKEAFEDEPLASLNLAAGETSYHDLDRSLIDPPRFPIGNSPRKSRKRDAFADRATKQRWIRKSFYCILLAVLVASAVVVVMFASGELNANGDAEQSDWQNGPEGELAPYEEDDGTMVPEYVPDSNLFEGDEIIACANAEHLEELNMPYFGSTWKSFWDGRINTCGDQMSTGYSIWYTFSTNTSKLVEASTCNNADFDTQITVLSGSCSVLDCVSFNDEACGSQSAVTWYAEANVTYYLMVSGYREASGTFGLTLSDATNHDDCFEAMGPLVPGSVVAGTTSGAQNIEVPQQCGDVTMSAPGVWYEIANVTGFFRAEILRGYTDFDGQVSVYRSMDQLDAGCGAMLCDKSSPTGNVTFLAEGKETYYLFVNGVNGTTGDFDLFFGQDRPSTCQEARNLDPNTIGYLASTKGANPQNVESCGYTGYHTAPGLWFSVEGTGKILQISTCGSLQNLDTQISVFANGCDTLQCIGGTGQDYPCGDNGKISWKTERGEAYHVFVSGRSSRVGDFVLNIEEVSQQDGFSCPASVTLDVGSMSYQSSTIDAPSSPVTLCDGNAAARGVWHEIVGTGKTLRVSLCNEETDFDARVSLYTGSCDNLACVAHTQSTCGEHNELLVTTHVGHKYYLFVHGPDSFSLGNYQLDVDETIINDSCETAPTLELSPARYFGSTRSATSSSALECGESFSDSNALWYRMIGNGETATLSTCSDITDFSTDITVYSGTCGSLFCVDTGISECGQQSSVSFETTINEEYFVRVGGNETTDTGNFVMDVSNMSPFFGSG